MPSALKNEKCGFVRKCKNKPMGNALVFDGQQRHSSLRHKYKHRPSYAFNAAKSQLRIAFD